MKNINLVAAAAFAFSSLFAFATPAAAQGTVGPIATVGQRVCPPGYKAGGRNAGTVDTMCHPGSDARPVYLAKGKCAAGYESASHWCIESRSGGAAKEQYTGPSAADQLVSYGTLPKANKLDRCPLGYFSKADMTICTTQLSPAPKSRKKSGACNSNEIDEWSLWCTADAKAITRQQAEQEATRDFNAIYSANGANYPAQGSDTENYPSMVAAYGQKGGKQASANTGTPASDTGSQTAQCDTSGNGSATGAAVGGAVAGDAGAALGSMLGGLGKKKKKKSGC